MAEKKQEIEYYIDREKRIIVAKLPNLREELARILDTLYSKKRDSESIVGGQSYYKLFRKINAPCGGITAKATCSEVDDFDVHIGMRIARERLMKKVNKWRVRLLEQYAAELELERDIVMFEVARYDELDDQLSLEWDEEVEEWAIV